MEMHGDGEVGAVGVVDVEVVGMAWVARTYVAVAWVDEGIRLELWVEEVDQAVARMAVDNRQRVGMDYNQAGREGEPVAVSTAGVDDIAESAAVVVVVASASDCFEFHTHSWRTAHFVQQVAGVVGMQPIEVCMDQL